LPTGREFVSLCEGMWVVAEMGALERSHVH